MRRKRLNVWRRIGGGIECRRERARYSDGSIWQGRELLWFRTPRVNGIRRVCWAEINDGTVNAGLGVYAQWERRTHPVAIAHAIKAYLGERT